MDRLITLLEAISRTCAWLVPVLILGTALVIVLGYFPLAVRMLWYLHRTDRDAFDLAGGVPGHSLSSVQALRLFFLTEAYERLCDATAREFGRRVASVVRVIRRMGWGLLGLVVVAIACFALEMAIT